MVLTRAGDRDTRRGLLQEDAKGHGMQRRGVQRIILGGAPGRARDSNQGGGEAGVGCGQAEREPRRLAGLRQREQQHDSVCVGESGGGEQEEEGERGEGF